VADLYAQVLGRARVGRDDDFFALGDVLQEKSTRCAEAACQQGM
jgi:uncharacterized protein YabN with tetrapyrrole methylase and pyrophosphatase domain